VQFSQKEVAGCGNSFASNGAVRTAAALGSAHSRQ
jgi:hypothetical protein